MIRPTKAARIQYGALSTVLLIYLPLGQQLVDNKIAVEQFLLIMRIYRKYCILAETMSSDADIAKLQHI